MRSDKRRSVVDLHLREQVAIKPNSLVGLRRREVACLFGTVLERMRIPGGPISTGPSGTRIALDSPANENELS